VVLAMAVFGVVGSVVPLLTVAVLTMIVPSRAGHDHDDKVAGAPTVRLALNELPCRRPSYN
jgi:hypothetical protein